MSAQHGAPSSLLRLVAGLLLLGLFLALAWVVLGLPQQAEGLRPAVAENIAVSGVTHPVTAVLLNFRGYDTLLELAVLLLALLGVWSLGRAAAPEEASPGAVLDNLPRLLLPLMVLVAGYLLWRGAVGPGGAFQAGAVLGAAGVLLYLAGWRLASRWEGWRLRLLLVAGVAVFVAVAVGVMFSSGVLLAYPPGMAGLLILLVEAVASVSIGVTLLALYLGGEPGGHP